MRGVFQEKGKSRRKAVPNRRSINQSVVKINKIFHKICKQFDIDWNIKRNVVRSAGSPRMRNRPKELLWVRRW